jgi:lipopolysaccharide transport system permease protein
MSVSTERIARVSSRRHVARNRSWVWSRDLLIELVVRDIKLRYRGSALGVLWTLLNPLAELLVLLFIFDLVLHVQIPNFAVYLFTGLIAYTWFSTSLAFATTAIVENRELVKRPGVPSILLPVVTVASNMVHFVLSLPILFGLLVLSGIPLTHTVIALPLLVAIQFAFILACTYPVAAIHVWFRDIQHIVRVFVQLLFYLTPVFYRTSDVPARLRSIYRLNPMAQIVDTYRAVLIDGAWPSPAGVLYVAIAAAALLAIGMSWFRRASYRFADEL